MEIKTVFGQNDITSIDTYFEYVKLIKHERDFRHGSDYYLDIKVAGPSFYDNNMRMETYDEEKILNTFTPGLNLEEDESDLLNDLLDSLGGHPLTAFYQDARLIGFQKR
jgi:hypothetical protein